MKCKELLEQCNHIQGEMNTVSLLINYLYLYPCNSSCFKCLMWTYKKTGYADVYATEIKKFKKGEGEFPTCTCCWRILTYVQILWFFIYICKPLLPPKYPWCCISRHCGSILYEWSKYNWCACMWPSEWQKLHGRSVVRANCIYI